MEKHINCALLFLASLLLFLQGASASAANAADVVAPAEVVAAAPAQPNLNGTCVCLESGAYEFITGISKA